MSDDKYQYHGHTRGGGNLAGGFAGTALVGEGRTQVSLQVQPQGTDSVLIITGGRAHVGAVATADGSQVQLSVVGAHKEGPLAEICAGQWALLTGKVCVAVVGIHQDEATKNEIDAIVENVRQGLEILADQWKGGCRCWNRQ